MASTRLDSSVADATQIPAMPRPEVTDNANFIARLQSLAPELFDLILVFTLRQPDHSSIDPYGNVVLDEDHIITIDRDWRPPNTLQLDRASREAGARVYYGTNIFACPLRDGQELLVDCLTWLKALPLSHLYHITQVRLCNINEISRTSYDPSAVWQGLKAGLSGRDVAPRFLQTIDGLHALVKRSRDYEAVDRCIIEVRRLSYLRRRAHAPAQFAQALDTKLYNVLRYTTGDDDGEHVVWWPIEVYSEDEMASMLEEDFRRWTAGQSPLVGGA